MWRSLFHFLLLLIGTNCACGGCNGVNPDHLNYDETSNSTANILELNDSQTETMRTALRVLVRKNAPFTLQLNDDTFSGIEVKLVKALAKKLRLEIELILDNNRSTLNIDQHR